MWELLRGDPEVQTGWRMANYVAATKLGMNDHGQTHATVATASALTMLDLLEGSPFCPDIITGKFGDRDDAALVVLAATLCHDLGNMVHREEHADLGVVLVMPVLDRLLPGIYRTRAQRTVIRSFILSAIYTHHGVPRPLTIEAALVCIADSTDMTKGRGRVAFESGSITIHSVSALAIEKVGDQKRGRKAHRSCDPHVQFGRDLPGAGDPRAQGAGRAACGRGGSDRGDRRRGHMLPRRRLFPGSGCRAQSLSPKKTAGTVMPGRH